MTIRSLALSIAIVFAGSALMSCTTTGPQLVGGDATTPQPATAERPSGAAVAPGAPAAITGPGPLSLPAPSTLVGDPARAGQPDSAGAVRTTSYVPADLFREAEAFDSALPHQHVAPTASGLAFDPGWLPQSPDITGLSFAMFPFSVKGYSGNPVLYYSWITAPPAPSTVYFGVANWSRDAWDWYALSTNTHLILPGLTDYIDFGGALLVCIVATGATASELNWLRLGSLPPNVELKSDLAVGMTPLSVQFDASGSVDPDSSIVDFRWDPEGDGQFTVSSGTTPAFSHEYSSAGSYMAAVKAVDNHGVYRIDSLPIDVLDGVCLSFGAPDVEEQPNAMLIGTDNHVLLFGERDSSPTTNSFPFFYKFSPAGEADFARSWAADGVFRDAVFAPDGNVYVCGTTAAFGAGGTDALLQKWTPAGELLWSKTIGGVDSSESLYAMLAAGDSLMVAGSYFLPAVLKHLGFVAQLDLEGNVLWATTVIGPSRTFYNDIGIFSPAAFGTPAITVVGDYWASDSDPDCIYASFNMDGDLLEARRWGDETDSEYGRSIYTSGNIFIRNTITAIERRSSGADLTIVADPHGSTVEIILPGIERMIPMSLLGSTLGLLKYGERLSIVIATIDIDFNVLSQSEYSASPNGSCSPDDLAQFSGGLMISGLQYHELPVAAPAGTLVVQPSATAWQEIFPSVTHPSQLVVASTPIDVVDQSGLEFNRAGDDGDTFIYFHRFE